MCTFILIRSLAYMGCTWCRCLYHHGYWVVLGWLGCCLQVSIFLTSKVIIERLSVLERKHYWHWLSQILTAPWTLLTWNILLPLYLLHGIKLINTKLEYLLLCFRDETTRLWFTIPLRESFGFPFIFAQLAFITVYFKRNVSSLAQVFCSSLKFWKLLLLICGWFCFSSKHVLVISLVLEGKG